jgi:hypothetical protein
MRVEGAAVHTRILLLFIYIAVGVFLSAPSLFAQREVFSPANDVSFTISTDQNIYRTGREITVKYEIVNISNHALFVPRAWGATCPPKPHVWAWFENPVGQHFIPGYAGDCSPRQRDLTERMEQEAVLLKPAGHFNGTIRLDTNLFGGLIPGPYRIEAVLYGWREEDFNEAQRSELARMAVPFLRGEVPASLSLKLTP